MSYKPTRKGLTIVIEPPQEITSFYFGFEILRVFILEERLIEQFKTVASEFGRLDAVTTPSGVIAAYRLYVNPAYEALEVITYLKSFGWFR